MEKEIMYMTILNNFLIKSILIQQSGRKNTKEIVKICIKETERVMEKVYGKEE